MIYSIALKHANGTVEHLAGKWRWEGMCEDAAIARLPKVGKHVTQVLVIEHGDAGNRVSQAFSTARERKR